MTNAPPANTPGNVTDTKTAFTIVPSTADDLPAIAALHARTFGPGRFARTAYRIREAMGGPPLSPHCHKARSSSGELAGAVTMSAITVGSTSGHWLLGPLAIRPELTGNGLGRALVEAVIAEARGKAEQLLATVGADNEGARRLYEALGFKTWGLQPRSLKIGECYVDEAELVLFL